MAALRCQWLRLDRGQLLVSGNLTTPNHTELSFTSLLPTRASPLSALPSPTSSPTSPSSRTAPWRTTSASSSAPSSGARPQTSSAASLPSTLRFYTVGSSAVLWPGPRTLSPSARSGLSSVLLLVAMCRLTVSSSLSLCPRAISGFWSHSRRGGTLDRSSLLCCLGSS